MPTGTPAALTFAAAALHRYPYGGSARIAQHLAPGPHAVAQDNPLLPMALLRTLERLEKI